MTSGQSHWPAEPSFSCMPTISAVRSARRPWLDQRDVARHFHIRLGHARDIDRLARMLAGRGVGLVLSGGGARGFAHIGVINALAEVGIEPDVVGGTSIGSVMGAWRAMDVRGDRLTRTGRRNFVDGGSPTSDFNLLPFISLIKGYKTRCLTEASVRDITGADIDIEDTWITFFCVSANYTTATEAVLARGPLAKSVLASYAIPGALPPIPIGGHLHVDGGTVNNLPVDVMGTFGVGTIIAVDLLSDTIRGFDLDWIPRTRDLLIDRLRPRSRRRYRLPSLGEILLNASVLHSVGRQCTMRDRADLCIRPALARVGLLEWKKFDAGRAQRLRLRGRRSCRPRPGTSRGAARDGRERAETRVTDQGTRCGPGLRKREPTSR